MKKNLLLGIMLATVAAGCTEHDGVQEGLSLEGKKITFAVSQIPSSETRSVMYASEPLQLSGYSKELWLVPEIEPMVSNVTTRGTQLTSSDFLTSFGVSAYKTPSSMDDLGGRTPDYFYNLKATRVGETSNYTISQDYYWPSNDERLWFYAYYPYNGSNSQEAGDNLNVVLSSAATTGPQTIDYTVAAAATDQVDLMTAKTGKTTDFLTEGSPSVELQFEHQLTGIRFKVGDQFPTKGYIQSIQLKNVYTHGIYTIGGTWSHESTDIGNFIVEYANDTKVTDTPGQMITDDNAVFLMIPATFTYEANTDEDDKAAIIVRFWDGDATQTVEASLEGTTWTAGQTVTYSLSSEKLTTLKIDHIDYATTVDGAPYTEWKNGDEVGLYVVNNGKNGGTDLRYTNVKCTYSKPNEQSAGSWVISKATAKHPQTNEDILVTPIMYPGDNYYFYYPYKAAGPDGTPSAGNESDASADKFWLSVINAHTVEANQSTPANFKASDLQVAKADVPTPTNGLAASSISATMARKVGLAIITLGTAQANKSITFTNGVAGTPTKANVTATSTFPENGNIPYLNGSSYYFYTVAGEETSISSSPTEKDAWESSLQFTLAPGTSEAKIAHSQRRNWDYINAVWTYSYAANNCYTWTSAPQGSGVYVMECWGASGGGSWANSERMDNLTGKGGYTIGTLSLNTPTIFYIYVGGKGTDAVEPILNSQKKYEAADAAGGYNGGGIGSWDGGDNESSGAGGGATDIRITNGNWDDFNSLKSRIMVAGGGGGQSWWNMAAIDGEREGYFASPGYGGGIEGGAVYAYKNTSNTYEYHPSGGTQTSGGGFGWGSSGAGKTGSSDGVAGGGGGYYGGISYGNDGEDPGNNREWNTASGGSSFISGLTGCNAITEGSTSDNIVHSGQANHYSGYVFTNASTIAGNASMPNPNGGNETGHTGNGYCRITLTRW